MLFDSNMSGNARQFILQDLFKQGPSIAKEVIGDVCEKVGIPGVSSVLEQVEKDIIPDLIENGDEYVRTVFNDAPKALQNMTESTMSPPSGGIDLQGIQKEARNTFTGDSEGYESPEYELLASKDGYEIRKYKGYLIAETVLKDQVEGSARELKSAKASGQGFNTLASYLFGKNEQKEAMSMTVPVRTESRKTDARMSFVIPRKYSTLNEVPEPSTPDVELREIQSCVVAVSKFTGFATEGEVERQYQELQAKLARDQVQVDSNAAESYTVLQYSGPNVLPNMRRNELCIPVRFSQSNVGVVS